MGVRQAQKAKVDDYAKGLLADLDDPLQRAIEGRSAKTFDEHGKVSLKFIRLYRDRDGNEFYAEGEMLPLDQARTRRDAIVGQSSKFFALDVDEQQQIIGNFVGPQSLGESTLPFVDFLTSRALGVQFNDLKMT